MQDWEKFAAGKESKENRVPLDKGMTASMYCTSKGMLNPWVRHFAKTHPKVKVAVVCPGESFKYRCFGISADRKGYCASELNGFRGTRSAEQGGESIIWPTLNEFESGKFYHDGKEIAYDQAVFDL